MSKLRVRLNLATQPQQVHRKFLVGASLVGIFAGIIFLALGWHVLSVRKTDERARMQAENLRLEMARVEEQRKDLDDFFKQPDKARLHDRAAFLNTIIDARSFNWTRMFMDLERTLPSGVHLLSIEPVQTKGGVAVKFSVGATSDEAKLKFLRALEESKEFSGIALQSEHAPARVENGDQSIVELTAVYSRT